MAKPKLALIPATQGTKLYSVLPADGVGDFDFSRGSAATRINKDGLIETVASGVSRLNYPLIDGVVNGCPSHLLEPTRSNLVTYSESFLGASGDASLTNSDALSPDGSINGFKISEVSTNSYQSRIYTNISYVSGSSYTVYVFAKASTNDRFVLFGQQSSQPIVGYDLTNGVILTESNVTSSFIDNYGNGWYRCGFTYTSALTQTSQYGINLIKEGTTNTYIYNGNTNQNVLFFGASLEQGSCPTSYIPTSGSTVTRSAETANGAGDASTFNDSEGVLMAEISALADDGTSRRISVTDAIGNDFFNLVSIELDESSGVVKGIVSNGTTVDILQGSLAQANTNKIALKYNSSSISLFINGFEAESNNSPNLPSGLKELTFNNGQATPFSFFYGNTKQLQVFDSALNDSDLETLTSWTSFTDMANGQLYSIK